MTTIVTRRLLPGEQRCSHTDGLFGLNFPMQLEPTIFSFASRLSPSYRGGYWEFYELGNGGFYMAPDADEPFVVSCPNDYEGQLSAEAFGIATCLYAYSHLSFIDSGDIREVYAGQYHLLREYMMEHPEAETILQAID